MMRVFRIGKPVSHLLPRSVSDRAFRALASGPIQPMQQPGLLDRWLLRR